MDALDISGYNYIDRKYKEKMYGPEHTKRPEKLCVGTETYKSTQHFTAYRDNDYVVGAFIWTGLDYFGESNQYPRRGSRSGFMDIAGNEKPEYYLYKSYWSEEPTVQIAVASKDQIESKWNWKQNDSLAVYVYSNCDEVELFLNNRSLGKKVVDKKTSYKVSWNVKYKEGMIKAVGYNAKKKVTEHVLKTASEAKRMSAKITKNTLMADGKDISLIEITMVDKNAIPSAR